MEWGRPWFDPWVGKIPWRRKWQPTPVLLPGESHGGRSLVGYSPWGCRVGHDWATSLSLSLGRRAHVNEDLVHAGWHATCWGHIIPQVPQILSGIGHMCKYILKTHDLVWPSQTPRAASRSQVKKLRLTGVGITGDFVMAIASLGVNLRPTSLAILREAARSLGMLRTARGHQ